MQNMRVKSQVGNHCCVGRQNFIYSDRMAKAEVHYSTTSTKFFPSSQHNSSIVFTNCTWQIIRDRTLSTVASETGIISEFPTLRIIDTVSNHSLLHIIQSRTIKILTFGSGWSKNISNITTKETGMISTWSHKWRIQNEKTNLLSLYNETELQEKLWARILFYFAGDIALHVYPYCCLRLAGYLHL